MNTIDAAHQVLHQVPTRLDVGGLKNPGATAYYVDVPTTALPAQCKLTRTHLGFNIEGVIDDCQFSGQAIEGENASQFRRVIISFVQTPETLH